MLSGRCICHLLGLRRRVLIRWSLIFLRELALEESLEFVPLRLVLLTLVIWFLFLSFRLISRAEVWFLSGRLRKWQIWRWRRCFLGFSRRGIIASLVLFVATYRKDWFHRSLCPRKPLIPILGWRDFTESPLIQVCLKLSRIPTQLTCGIPLLYLFFSQTLIVLHVIK